MVKENDRYESLASVREKQLLEGFFVCLFVPPKLKFHQVLISHRES